MSRQNVFRLPGVFAVEVSGNRKLGLMSATYVAQGSCPHNCPFLCHGCYAETGPLGWQTARLNDAGQELSVEELAENEAAVIGALSGRLPLRPHVVGDSPTRQAARTLARAAARYHARHGQPVFTYTHAHRDVQRDDWGPINILASCESPRQAAGAIRRGYAAAMTVRRFEAPRAYSIGHGLKLIPCPEMVKEGVTCSTCMLCANADRLQRSRLVIGFEAHGSGARRLPLPVLEHKA